MKKTCHGQSRVDIIKKKFENSFSEVNSARSVSNATNPCMSKFMSEFKDLNINKRFENLRCDTSLEKNVNKSEGKAFVKRSQAFRREKLGHVKSLTQTSEEKLKNLDLKQESEYQKENAQEKLFKDEFSVVNIQKDLKRSKTDTNLLKHCFKNSEEGITFQKQYNSKKVASLAGTPDDSNECIAVNEKLPQYSIVNKKKSNCDKSETISLKFTESIRRALQSPLPRGPPPKKPPRTFCHVPQQNTHTGSLANRLNALSTATTENSNSVNTTTILNADIPKLKSKLDKLEKLIKVNETHQVKDLNKKINKFPKNKETCSMPDVTGSFSSCLPISTCVNKNEEISNFKKELAVRSEFYFDLSKTCSDSSELKRPRENCVGSTSGGLLFKAGNPEVIYDLPCVNKKNSFETFGKCSKDLKESVNARKAEGLHYMCTDVINQAPAYPKYSPNTECKKSKEDKIQKGISDISKSTSQQTLKTNKCINVTEQNDAKVKSAEESSGSGGVLEESSEESEPDFLIHSSDSSKAENNNAAEALRQMSAKRKIYVRRVSSKLTNQVSSCWENKNKNSYSHLFECCLLVGLTLCESKQNVPYIKTIFPPGTKPPPLIEFLCFPDASYWPPNSENDHPEEQSYSLVVTNENGERKFGYCRRVLPEGGHVCLPLTYCIISSRRAGGFFYKVLEELESRHGSSGIDNFIKQLYESEFPGPGERLKLKEILEKTTGASSLHSDSNLLSSTLIRRPPDLRLEEKNLTQLFHHLQLSVVLKVFASLLHERKVLFLSSSLRNLSSCIEALQSILLPFSWQHTFIPLLPVHLIEMCEAPTPYVIGLLKPKNVEKSLSSLTFEDGILVDLDDSKILKCCGDEGSILPLRYIRDLKTSLNLALNATDSLSESLKGVLISDAFIRFFVQVCGNYSKFITDLPHGEKIFQKEQFVKSVSSNARQAFLNWFTETTMFNSFIQDRLQSEEENLSVELFRRRASEHSAENPKDSAVFLKNYKVINKKVKTLSDKIKDFNLFNK